MEDVRIRLPELLGEKKVTAHRLSVLSGGKLALPTVYKLVSKRGVVTYLDARTLKAIYDALNLKSMDELLTNDPPPPRVKRVSRRPKQGEARAA